MTKNTGKDKQDSKVVPISGATVGRATGASGKTRQRSAKRPSGLTDKQEAFCEGVVQGLSLSDAYRSAYDHAGMAAHTVNREAHRLMTNHQITTRCESLHAQQVQMQRMLALGRSQQVLKSLEDIAHDIEMPPNSRVAALVALGKSCALFTDVIETSDITAERSADDIRDAIEAKLARYQ